MNEASKPIVSLIIPAYNEEKRIGKSLEQILCFCNAQDYPYEVLVVDDGSTDDTVAFVRRRFGDVQQLRIFPQPERRGKGAAVQQGMLQGGGEYLFFSDADLSVPIEALPAFLAELKNNAAIAISSRRAPGAVIEIHQPYLRELMGRIFTALSNLVLGLRHSDATCGFKGFRRDIARELFTRQRLHNWSFDCELLYLAALKGYRVSEIPVTWRNDRATKVRLWKDVIASFLGLLSIRKNHLLGKYR
ncbi:MAG TPA: dolichyl-phosphate beta-glucosyltransferase [Candidatus Binatia bacterium]|nr:dolichyl-phosphate beta-glucosyltransferase [Candidatus Binatia bacterium]